MPFGALKNLPVIKKKSNMAIGSIWRVLHNLPAVLQPISSMYTFLFRAPSPFQRLLINLLALSPNLEIQRTDVDDNE